MTAEVERPEDTTFVRRPAFSGAMELKKSAVFLPGDVQRHPQRRFDKKLNQVSTSV